MTKLVARRAILAGLSAVALAAPNLARAAQRTARLGHVQPAGSAYALSAQAIADAAAADPVLSPVLRIDVRHQGELGDELSMLENCRNGTVDMGLVGHALAANVAAEAGLLDIPFLFGSVAAGRTAMDGPIGAEFAALLAQKQLHVFGWGEAGLRHFSANRPIRRPEDLRGFKLRVPQSASVLANFRALGADANALSWTEVPEALRTGQFDGYENPIGVIESARLTAVQRFLCLSGHTYAMVLVLVSPDVLEDLTAPQAAALRRAVHQGVLRSRALAEANEQAGVDRLRAAGMTVVDDVDRAAFRAAFQPRMAELAQQFGAALVQRLSAAAAAAA